MTSIEVEDKLVKIIADFAAYKIDHLTREEFLAFDLEDQLGLDSLDMAELSIQIEIAFEEHFDMLPYEAPRAINTVAELITSVKGTVCSAGPFGCDLCKSVANQHV